MIAGIAQSISSLPLPRVARLGSGSGASTANGLLGTTRTPDSVAVMFDRSQPDIVRSGFGEGTLSLPTAAIRTLGRGLESAGRIVESLQQRRDEARARLAEQRRAQQREVRFTNPAQQSRDFVNALNRTAETALARVEGAEPPQTEPRASLQINGRVFNYVQTQADVLGPAAAQTLDLTA
ncbi:MAG: hypothetical protein GWP08_07830 [Nitrospiraceae bacterium]|nr:hypothetical protein [Nitrospiraceae bacterium]